MVSGSVIVEAGPMTELLAQCDAAHDEINPVKVRMSTGPFGDGEMSDGGWIERAGIGRDHSDWFVQ